MKTRIPSNDFLPILERHKGISLERQLVIGIRNAILEGRLAHGTRLASSRQLAAQLGVNRNTVIAALEQLQAEGCIETRHGSGTFVVEATKNNMPNRGQIQSARWLLKTPAPQIAKTSQASLEFQVCLLSTENFPLAAWQGAWRTALQKPPNNDYGCAQGEIGFRQAISNYLGRARGLHCSPEDIVVTSGAIQAMNLIAKTTLQSGSSVAFEDPGYPLARQVLGQDGVNIVPIPVDENGLCVEQLPTGKDAPTLVYVTPSHQFPLGGRLPLARRLALLEWAENNDALILEDDYDSEFRFDVPPLPPLASLDQAGRVVYVGTFSKVLSPALRVGYAIATPALRTRLTHQKTVFDYQTSPLTQTALQHLIEHGTLERHIARMRRVYAQKRATLVAALEPISAIAQPRGLEAGINIFLEFAPEFNVEALQNKCLEYGLEVSSIAQYQIGKTTQQGLVLGYGGLSLTDIIKASQRLIKAIGR